jgi:hypothetical protein
MATHMSGMRYWVMLVTTIDFIMPTLVSFRCSGWAGGQDRAFSMATFIVLASFTDKVIGKVKETIGRAEKFKEMAKKGGIAVKDLYWTLGSRDVVAVCEAPDETRARRRCP